MALRVILVCCQDWGPSLCPPVTWGRRSPQRRVARRHVMAQSGSPKLSLLADPATLALSSSEDNGTTVNLQRWAWDPALPVYTGPGGSAAAPSLLHLLLPPLSDVT